MHGTKSKQKLTLTEIQCNVSPATSTEFCVSTLSGGIFSSQVGSGVVGCGVVWCGEVSWSVVECVRVRLDVQCGGVVGGKYGGWSV